MRVILDIKDSEAVHLMAVLKSLPYVTTQQVTDEKTQLVEEIKEAVDELILVKAGKKKARPARELLNEL